MRYFAILKDSFREALDSKVMYVLFAISTLSVLVVATLSFRPLSAQATMEQFFPNAKLGGVSVLFFALYHPELKVAGLDEEDVAAKEKRGDGLQEKMQPIYEFKLEKVELLSGEADSPQSDYVVTLVDTMPRRGEKAGRAEILKQGEASVRTLFEKAVALGFFRLGEIQGEIEGKEGADLTLAKTRFRVTLHGTSQTHRIWAHEPSFFFGALPLEGLAFPLSFQLYILSKNVLSLGAWIAILVGVVITSFFIPSMLAKGTVDMLLVKPIHRWAILLYKYVGGLTFIFLNSLYAMFGMWLVLGLRTGVWAHGLFLLVLTMTFFFAILYAVSTFVGVATRSTIASIIVAIAAWAACFSIGLTHKIFDTRGRSEARMEKRQQMIIPAEQRWGDSRLAQATGLLHAITPRTEELNVLNDNIVYFAFMTSVFDMGKFESGERPFWESVLVSGIWIAVFLTASCVWFTFKDY